MNVSGPTSDAGATSDDQGTGHGVVRIASVAALGGLLFGYETSVINGATKALEEDFAINSGALGFAVASALLGAAAGALTAGRIADRIGRLMVMKIAAVLFVLSAVGCAFAPSSWGTGGLVLFIVFRVVGGFAVGVASVIAPAYIAETSPAGIRGRLGSLQQLAIVLGIFLSFLVNLALRNIAGGANEVLWLGMDAWRWMFLMMAVPAILYGVLSGTIPESPRYLISQQRLPEARAVLERLLGARDLELTIDSIRASMNSEKKPSWRDLKRPAGGIYPVVWIGLLLSVFQQAVGINVVFYYSNVLWEAAGFDESQAFLTSTITSVINIATTLVAIALVDRVGRRPLLLVGSVGMTVTLAAVAVCFGQLTDKIENGQVVMKDGEAVQTLPGAWGVVALIAANGFVVFFGMSWGPMVWVLLGEMFPNRFRAAALSVAAAGQWAANWVITMTFPAIKDFSLTFGYFMYAAFAFLSFLFVAKFVPETKGRSLEDMDRLAGVTDDA
ncbi:MFS transporter, sugar porter (SP) family [Gordonia malaquae]|uniref:Putative sugar transporter n=1 Tax=Gordonia malaquae NBRC 108250 TaxID=1223542 RepID=M3UUA1_GORML|nr:sugar porter family MFS transporter [Gordonia malaquae]GAC79002.1 putative sugar transporter [Gordonia malaquae NBRC 108250]SEB62920.1 MFS transporter, sugar porter (SP) family [Gordonia malaquae]